MMLPSEFYIGGPSIIVNTQLYSDDLERSLFHEIYHFSQLIGSSYGLTLLYANRIFHNTVNEYIAFIIENNLCPENSPIENLLPDILKNQVANIHKIEVLKFKQKVHLINSFLDLLLYESRGPIDRYTTSIKFFLESFDIDREIVNSFIYQLEDSPDERGNSYLHVGKQIGQVLTKWGVDLVDNDTALLIYPKMVLENYASFFSFFYDKMYETSKFGSDLAPFDLYEQYPADFVALNLALMELFQDMGNKEEILCSIFGLYELSLMTDFHPAAIKLLPNGSPVCKYFDSFSVSKRFIIILKHMLNNGLITGVRNQVLHNYQNDLDGICCQLQWAEYSRNISTVKNFLAIPDKSIFNNRFSDSNRYVYQWALDFKTDKSFTPGHWSTIVEKLSSALIPLVVLRDDRDFIILNKQSVFPQPGDSSSLEKRKKLFVKSAANNSFYTTFWEMFCRDLVDGDGFNETKKFIKKDVLTVVDVIGYQFELAQSIDWAERAESLRH